MKALLMAGGRGTRFWPLSVEACPKQFLRLAGERTLLQGTLDRLLPLLSPQDVFAVVSPPYEQETRRQLSELPAENIIVEPAGRNTGPCIGWASLKLRRRFSAGEVVAVLPADHVIPDVADFQEALRQAQEPAREGWLVVFGIPPTYPATGFGYIERGDPIALSETTAFRVRRFVEKPSVRRARRLLARGGFWWNSGVFVWRLDRILEELSRHAPELFNGLLRVEADSGDTASAFSRLPSVSIDHAVMERTERAAVIPARFRWSDVGSWKALEEIRPADESGLIREGQVVQVHSRDSIVLAGDRLVALVGVKDLVVVDTPRALLVASRERAEDVKLLVEQLRALGLNEFL